MENNFYITCPNEFADFLINFDQENRKFTYCNLKCGEAIGQTIDERLSQEASHSGNMCKIYTMYIDTQKISTEKSSHFDSDIFGHQNITTVYETTIWNFLPNKRYMPKSMPNTPGYGQEYMELSAIINYWLKNKEYKILIDNICKTQMYSPEYKRGVLFLLQVIFNDNFDDIVKKYITSLGSETVKKSLSLFKHQALVLYNVYKMLNAGMRHIITELPPRFGKTLTWLKMFKDLSVQDIMIVYAYADTVGNSYFKEIKKYADFNDFNMIDADNVTEEMRLTGKTVIYVRTTGTEKTIQKRIDNLKIILTGISGERIFNLNEEADFANFTEKSNNKFKMILDSIDPELKSIRISTTGTDAYKAELIKAFGNVDGNLTVNYNNWEEIIV